MTPNAIKKSFTYGAHQVTLETGEISRQTTRFLTRCQEVGISEEKRDDFLDELALIEDLLRHRFTR